MENGQHAPQGFQGYSWLAQGMTAGVVARDESKPWPGLEKAHMGTSRGAGGGQKERTGAWLSLDSQLGTQREPLQLSSLPMTSQA